VCIDACNEIMDKVGRPRGLVAYDTIRNLESVGSGILPVNWLRPRVILYATLMIIVGVIMLTALLLRPELEVSVLHDRNPIYVKLSDGGLRNGYTVKLLNKLYQPRSFKIALQGLPRATLSIVGHDKETDPVVTVAPDELQSVQLYVALDKGVVTALPNAATDFSFIVTDVDSATRAEHIAIFQGPER
jgi:polyferredoxin